MWPATSKFDIMKTLSEFLKGKLDAMEGERSDHIKSISSESNISETTVEKILDGDIKSPELKNLRGFARTFSISMVSIIKAANEGGCEYEMTSEEKRFDKGTKFLAKDHASLHEDEDEEEDDKEEDEDDDKSEHEDDEDEDEEEDKEEDEEEEGKE